ncbi:DUF938 domain-containing protein [Bosea sp. PAMC 26642]|uniref:DUF938 domain-containing protein n=1 Tax=Bosea sp. (strain PAMC 26642) TaxID=1792307 RepID=UPI0007705D6C|nr:DUF938 domain-containing protein [Bosea sp. PAMC 26642]AMJ60447.1 SAM-dependent methyltransferase [Bosea sp. PAMC 26642]
MSDTSSGPWEPGAAQTIAGEDHRLFAPAATRNRDAILPILRAVLPATGLVLEVASGSGEHIVHLAQALPALTFQPSDPSPEALASIAAWTAHAGLANIRSPLQLDATTAIWPLAAADAVICINMIHIAPWSATQGLLRGAGTLLADGAPLYLYGPFRRPGQEMEASNAAFDESLKARNPDWGLRDLDAVAGAAAEAGFGVPEITEMPANNLSVVFRKRQDR